MANSTSNRAVTNNGKRPTPVPNNTTNSLKKGRIVGPGVIEEQRKYNNRSAAKLNQDRVDNHRTEDEVNNEPNNFTTNIPNEGKVSLSEVII